MSPASSLLLAIAALVVGPAAKAAELVPQALVPHGSNIRADGLRLELGEADDPDHPRAWQGPIRITQASGATCTVSDDVGIVEQPIWQVGRELYVSTYSGSESALYVVDSRSCAVRWTSPPYVGRASVSGTGLSIPGQHSRPIAADGIPFSR